MGVLRIASADSSIPLLSVSRTLEPCPVCWYRSLLDKATVKGAIRASTRASEPNRTLQRVAPRAILSDCFNATAVRFGYDVSSCCPLIAFALRSSATGVAAHRCSEYMKRHSLPSLNDNFVTPRRSLPIPLLIG